MSRQYTAIIRFALWIVLICAATIQSQVGAAADHHSTEKQGNIRATGTRQRIELMVPGLTADAPYQELKITKQVEAGSDNNPEPDSEAASSEATEGSGTIIHQFVEFTGTAFGQLVAVGFIIVCCWSVCRRIQREEVGEKALLRSRTVSV